MAYIGSTHTLVEEWDVALRAQYGVPEVPLDYNLRPSIDKVRKSVERPKVPHDVIRGLCLAYLADFCCLGFPFPPECSDLRCDAQTQLLFSNEFPDWLSRLSALH